MSTSISFQWIPQYDPSHICYSRLTVLFWISDWVGYTYRDKAHLRKDYSLTGIRWNIWFLRRYEWGRFQFIACTNFLIMKINFTKTVYAFLSLWSLIKVFGKQWVTTMNFEELLPFNLSIPEDHPGWQNSIKINSWMSRIKNEFRDGW